MARIVNSRCVLAVRDLEVSTRSYKEVLGLSQDPIDLVCGAEEVKVGGILGVEDTLGIRTVRQTFYERPVTNLEVIGGPLPEGPQPRCGWRYLNLMPTAVTAFPSTTWSISLPLSTTTKCKSNEAPGPKMISPLPVQSGLTE